MTVARMFAVILAVLSLVLFAWCIFVGVGRFALDPVLPEHQVWALLLAALIEFFDWLVIIVVAAALLAFSLASTAVPRTRVRGTVLAWARPVLVMVVILGVINGLWFGLIASRVELRLQQYSYQSRTARRTVQEAEQLLSREQFVLAEEQILLHQALVGESDRAMDILQAARAGRVAEEETRRERQPDGRSGAGVRASEVSELSVADLVGQARDFMRRGDYFSAHFFASLAVEQSVTPRQDARSLQAEALNRIEAGAREIDEAEARSLYLDKILAYQAYQRGETMPEQAIEAFFRFQDLQERIPRDPDVQRFLPLAAEQVSRISFFVEDARSNQVLPGRSRLVFVNRRTSSVIELVSVDHVVRVRGGDYFYGIEVMRLDRNNFDRPLLHVHAPFGKRIGERLVLRAVRREGDFRDGPGNTVQLQVFADQDADFDGELFLYPTVDEIVRYAGGPEALSALALPDLLGLPEVLERIGRPVGPARVALLRRILRIAGFFILAIGAVASGRRFRSRYLGRPPVLVILLIPALFYILWRLVEIARFVIGAAADTLAVWTTPGTAIMIIVGAVAVGTVYTVASLARQTFDS